VGGRGSGRGTGPPYGRLLKSEDPIGLVPARAARRPLPDPLKLEINSGESDEEDPVGEPGMPYGRLLVVQGPHWPDPSTGCPASPSSS